MSRLIGLAFLAALVWVAALSASLPPRTVEATPQWDVAMALSVTPTPYQARLVATGTEWGYEATVVGILPPPPPPPRVYRDHGPAPALTGTILTIAGRYIGVSYVYGGKSPSGFDCSGFVVYVYAKAGYSLPAAVADIYSAGTVTTSPQPGDIIWTSHHVALYVAPGWQIDAPRPGKTIQIRPIWQSNPTYIHVN